MTLAYDTDLTIYGDQADIKRMIDVLTRYRQNGERDAYFCFITLMKEKCSDPDRHMVDLESAADEMIAPFLALSKIKVSAVGPYGRFFELNDIDLFREMAEAAPDAGFVANIDGDQDYCVQRLKCELKDKKLYIKTFYQDDEDVYEAIDEAWKEYFMKKLPFKKFRKLFKTSWDVYDDEIYADVIESLSGILFDGFEYVNYDEFISIIEADDGETKLTEARFKEIMNDDLFSLGIMNRSGFEDKCEYDIGEIKEYVYDPVSKQYEEIKTNYINNVTVREDSDT